MQYVKKGNKIFLRLDKGDEICKCITAVADKENIAFASIAGIGATNDFAVGVFDSALKVYERFEFSGTHEINSVTGNLTRVDGKPYLHLHITCTGKGCKVVGGHLLRAVVSLTAEIVITVSDINVTRKHDETLGINIWEF